MRRLIALAAAVATVAAMLVAGASPASAYHTLGNHWAHNGLSHSQIYFVDETGAFWPVTTVTYKWNEAQGVDSFYVTSCPRSGLICPHVVEYNGASGSPDPTCNTAYGCTTRTLLPGSAKHYGTARVYLNTRRSTPRRKPARPRATNSDTSSGWNTASPGLTAAA